MLGDVREAAEARLLANLSALTTANGLPQAFGLVTRELLHLSDLKTTQLPACLLQLEEPEVVPKLGAIFECTVPGRIIVAFAPTTQLPATVVNAYRVAIERMLTNDIHLNGLVDAMYLNGHLQPGIWEGVGLLALGVLFRMIYEWDPKQPAVTA